MKRIYIAVLMSLLLFCGCTQNNGHLGPIFGSWALVGITENGTQLTLEEETVFSFQNEIVQVIKLELPPYTPLYRYGNFSLSDNLLTLRFQAKPTENDSYLFITPNWLHFPQDGKPIQFDITVLRGDKMEWHLTTESGSFIYSFKKTW